ncbi:hypothetical protein RZE82_03880 [Mollicutes bacterium LVI A0039]|nr:hypothetical protein RZE82_03880 [Mollicutes bacterium LVI A0039]
MIINISNKTGKDRIVTSIDQGEVKTYTITKDNFIEFECHETLVELECDGTVLFIPNALDAMNYTLIEDKEVLLARIQINVVFIISLIIMCSITLLTLKANIMVTGLFLIIQALIIFGMYNSLRTEQRGETVFITR